MDAVGLKLLILNHWGVEIESVGESTRGVSRTTYQVGNYWLSVAQLQEYDVFLAETKSIIEVQERLSLTNSKWQVPTVVPTLNNLSVVQHNNFAWRLTKNISGFHPNSQDPQTYPCLVEALHCVHKTFSDFNDFKPHQTGVSIQTRKYIQKFQEETWTPFTQDIDELAILEQAVSFILPSLPNFESQPKQLIHGDWTPNNIIFNSDNTLNGLLDFESLCNDTILVDLSSTASTILMWSGLDNPKLFIDSMLSDYRRISTNQFIRNEDVYFAMVCYWFCHYWRWRERLIRNKEALPHQVVGRLILRLRLVLSFTQSTNNYCTQSIPSPFATI